MKNVFVVGVAALALAGCAKTEEAPAEAAPAVEATESVEAGNTVTYENGTTVEVPADAQVASGEVSSSEPAKEPVVVAPPEAK